MQQFGKAPKGERLERLKKSPNYKDGTFRNLSHTPPLKEGVSYYEVFRKFFFDKSKRVQPGVPVPAVKSDLKAIPAIEDVIVWFGHSSYFMQLSGVRILVDPVFSGNASPFSFTTKSFAGADAYGVDDMPQIDYLFISHDHYDHLDYKTVKALKPKVSRVVTGLGVGAHLEHWGYDPSIITERDWHDTVHLEDGFKVTYAPSRHFSGRGLKRNGTLWTSFILQTPQRRIYLGGDSGYDAHFAQVGRQHGPFDLAILEDGQYNDYWKYIHMMPEEVVKAAQDLNAKTLFPVHWSKFALSIHDWDEPIKRIVTAAEAEAVPLIHPRIGRIVNLDNMQAHNEEWWTDIS